MKRFSVFALLGIIFILTFTAITKRFLIKEKEGMKISSSAFENNGKIPSKYTCDGENINPPLSFLAVPENTKSLVLIVDDPDALSGTWVHWVLFNIPSKTITINEQSIPIGSIEGITNFGKPGYGGPCPPSGNHRYFFKLYALDTTLDLFSNVDKKTIEEKMQSHILEKANLIGLYKKM